MKEQYPNHTCTPCYSPWWNSHLHQTNQNWSASSNSTNLLLTRTVTKWRQISGHEMPWLRHTWLPRSQVRQVYFLSMAKLQTLLTFATILRLSWLICELPRRSKTGHNFEVLCQIVDRRSHPWGFSENHRSAASTFELLTFKELCGRVADWNSRPFELTMTHVNALCKWLGSSIHICGCHFAVGWTLQYHISYSKNLWCVEWLCD